MSGYYEGDDPELLRFFGEPDLDAELVRLLGSGASLGLHIDSDAEPREYSVKEAAVTGLQSVDEFLQIFQSKHPEYDHAQYVARINAVDAAEDDDDGMNSFGAETLNELVANMLDRFSGKSLSQNTEDDRLFDIGEKLLLAGTYRALYGVDSQWLQRMLDHIVRVGPTTACLDDATLAEMTLSYTGRTIDTISMTYQLIDVMITEKQSDLLVLLPDEIIRVDAGNEIIRLIIEGAVIQARKKHELDAATEITQATRWQSLDTRANHARVLRSIMETLHKHDLSFASIVGFIAQYEPLLCSEAYRFFEESEQ